MVVDDGATYAEGDARRLRERCIRMHADHYQHQVHGAGQVRLAGLDVVLGKLGLEQRGQLGHRPASHNRPELNNSEAAQDSIAGALSVAAHVGDPTLAAAACSACMHGMTLVLGTAAGITPGRPSNPPDADTHTATNAPEA